MMDRIIVKLDHTGNAETEMKRMASLDFIADAMTIGAYAALTIGAIACLILGRYELALILWIGSEVEALHWKYDR